MRKYLGIEILLISIIAVILLAIIVPKVMDSEMVDKVPKTYSDIRALSSAIHLYYLDHHELPDKLEKLHSRDNPKGKQYIAKEFKDPWGNSYIYRFTNKEELKSIFIYSLGENGKDDNCSGDDECYPEMFNET